MTDLEKYTLINRSESPKELQQSLAQIAEDGFIPGSRRPFRVQQQIDAVDMIIKGYPANLLTRSYGIRQQMLYILHYAKL